MSEIENVPQEETEEEGTFEGASTLEMLGLMVGAAAITVGSLFAIEKGIAFVQQVRQVRQLAKETHKAEPQPEANEPAPKSKK